MPYIWLIVIGLLAILLLYGDTRSRHSILITPEKAAALSYAKWPMWKEIEPPDNRIRMLWIDQDYVPFVNAGSEICSHQFNKHFMKKPYKYDIWKAVPGYPQRTYEGVRCFDLNDKSLFYKVLNSSHILHSHSGAYRSNMLYLSRITGKPFVGWVHTDRYVRGVRGAWNDRRLGNRQWTVFNSVSLRESRAELKDHNRTEIFFPTVDFHDYAVDKKERKPMYVTLSNVNENKGGNILIQLAKALPEIEFLGILGGYRKQITTDTLPNLRYKQHTSQIKDIYAQTWVQIMPSQEETWGRTAVEAMSSGIPVVVSPTPGLRECCQDAAIYCNRNDLEGWVQTLRQLKQDQSYYNQRSTVALARARALDPLPDFQRMEDWIEKRVFPSAEKGRSLSELEKNLLFR